MLYHFERNDAFCAGAALSRSRTRGLPGKEQRIELHFPPCFVSIRIRMKLETQLIETRKPEDFREPWSVLQAHAAEENPFYFWEWACAWYAATRRKQSLVLWVQVDPEGNWVFLMPFVQVPGIRGKGLWPLAYHSIDWVNPLVHEDQPGVVANIPRDVSALLRGYQFIWLPLLRPGPVADQLMGAGRHRLLRPASQRHYFALPPAAGSEVNLRERGWGPKQMKNIDYLRRKLAREGAVTFLELGEDLDVFKLIALEKRSWKAGAGVALMNSALLERVYAEVLPSLIGRGKIRLSVLALDSRWLAYEIGFLLKGGGYGLHHIAFDQAWESFSPGKLLMDENIRTCLHRGFRYYDFLQGSNAYKQRWAESSDELTELSLYGRGFLPWLLYQMTRRLQKRHVEH